MYISFIIFPLFLVYLGVLEGFIINRNIFHNYNNFLLLASSKKKKNTIEEAPKRKNKNIKEKKKKNKILETLLKEKVEKVKVNLDYSGSQNVDKEILEGKRVPRLRIKKTNNHIYATIVDDYKRHVLCFSCSHDSTLSQILGTYRKKTTNRIINNGKTIKAAWEIGKIVAKKALNKGIFKVKFDRANYKYEGRVEALAEGARAVGLLL
ncbi:apicoplast ribosomal protein L18 precursor, putative [Plasmodium gallinaceum]|uniref:Apicoplast ribosomal protein L18, putative n=1 Tax=Plasmodium gallinaceum TaxID=5849 RepID=A0A1J1GRQ8_PLAGA|nr:apicoplast ribosomal protein L18 precursor, putative [Plasmodium gallinaceum]CRG93714.1 apicoplast ribosomal protein L18 precursor, putative [Plasmodium gallinaceum]